MQQKKILLYSLTLMMLVDAIGIGLVFPILPDLFLNKDIGLAHEGTFMLLTREELYSVCLAVFPLGSIFGMPILGDLSDRLGRRKVLLFGLGFLALNYLFCASMIFTHRFRLFILARFVAGFLSGTYSVAGAMVSDISANSEERVANFKLPILGSLVGIIIGPSLSIFIYKIEFIHPLAFPFIIAFILAGTNFIMLFYCTRKLYRESGTINDSDTAKLSILDTLKTIFTSNMKNLISHLIQMFSHKTTKFLSLTYFLFQFAFATFLQSLSIYLALTHHFTSFEIGRFFIIMSVAMIFGMYGLHKLVKNYITDIWQVQIGLLIIVILFFLQTLFESFHLDILYIKHLYIIWAVSVVFYMTLPFITLNFTNLFSIGGTRMEQGQIMGAMGLLYSIAWCSSGLMIGPLMKHHYDVILMISTLSMFISYLIFHYRVKK